MRVAVVDIGSNSTRLLIADVDPTTGTVVEVDRHSTVTRLGQAVDHTQRLQPEAVERVTRTLTAYRHAIDDLHADAAVAILTSAVRDALNGEEFTTEIAERFALEARILTGDEEARLTFKGATSDRDPDDARTLVVIDIGGGSTEFVTGLPHREPDSHVSSQAGVVRQSERFIRSDPPERHELQQLAAEAREIFAAAVPDPIRDAVQGGIAVAGTPTSCAAMLQELEPYDPTKVHGFRLLRAQCEMLLARLAGMTNEERRHVKGLHPDRASVIVAGVVLLIEAMRSFGLDEVEVSEHDILRGAALDRAAVSA
jgi:exopolyphosphatase/guanosine-5'-triphosphate,3'-diphosphate pyrophosphatase